MPHRLLSLNHIESEQFEGKPHALHSVPFRPLISFPIGIVGKPNGGFCIICIMRSMEADCLEYQRVTHIRVSMGNRLCTLGFLGDQGTPFPYKSHMLKRLQQIPRIQWVAWRTVPVTGAGAVQGRQCTIPVATRGHVLPIPVHVGDRQAPETYRFRCNQGQKGSVMHRFRGHGANCESKKSKHHHGFPGSGVARGP